ncbi:MAG TPA: alpha/beta hydrolase [Gemmatimonadaceae bacterium]|nr:alpha/beta hydrolase [Gemmatimonadaceae bacterium]
MRATALPLMAEPSPIPPSERWPNRDPAVEVRHIVLSGGDRVRTVAAGPAGGQPALLIHGWACSAFLFRKNFAALAAAGYRAIALDLRGHGESDKPEAESAYTLGAMTTHVLEAMHALGLPPAVLVGQSMGGRIALEAARRAPERATRVVLIDSVGFGRVGASRVLRLAGWHGFERLLPHLVRRETIRLVLRATSGARRRFTERDIDEYVAASRSPEFLRAMQTLLRVFAWEPLNPEFLDTVSHPLLLVLGTRDRVVRFHRSNRLLRERPGLTVSWIEGAGHAPNEEMPEETNRVIVEWLAPLIDRSRAMS